jgi:hypothetical protein
MPSCINHIINCRPVNYSNRSDRRNPIILDQEVSPEPGIACSINNLSICNQDPSHACSLNDAAINALFSPIMRFSELAPPAAVILSRHEESPREAPVPREHVG